MQGNYSIVDVRLSSRLPQLLSMTPGFLLMDLLPVHGRNFEWNILWFGCLTRAHQH